MKDSYKLSKETKKMKDRLRKMKNERLRKKASCKKVRKFKLF